MRRVGSLAASRIAVELSGAGPMPRRATLIDHRRAARRLGASMFAIFGLLIYVAIGLAWLVFAMFRLTVWLIVVLISAA